MSPYKSKAQVKSLLDRSENSKEIAEHYWLSYFWKNCIFSNEYAAPENLVDFIVPTEFGMTLIEECYQSANILKQDATLALYGQFFWDEILIDIKKSDLDRIMRLFDNGLFDENIRLAYTWGRLLEDKLYENSDLAEREVMQHADVWRFLDDTPIGINQHGLFLSGPLGILRSQEHRWFHPLNNVFSYFLKGTKVQRKPISFDTASIGVVEAFETINHILSTKHGKSSEWKNALLWYGSPQDDNRRTDYTDVPFVISECLIGQERTKLLEHVLKSNSGKLIRSQLKLKASTKRISTLPPTELAAELDEYQQMQALLILPTKELVNACDKLILTAQIQIPGSEVRLPGIEGVTKGVCFSSEISSLGIRAAHTEPFIALCSAIIRAYEENDSVPELIWRLRSGPIGVQALTEYVRREGPSAAVSQLILACPSVTEYVCNELQLNMAEVESGNDSAIARILWKFGFELPRHDEVLGRLISRLNDFEILISEIDFDQGEKAREKIRSDGVNVFVSAEEFLDKIISYNVWLLTSDHWAGTRFSYRTSDARSSVSKLLDSGTDILENEFPWNENGENTLGVQLAYLDLYEKWIGNLENITAPKRKNCETKPLYDEFQRPFPYQHKELWADSDTVELEKYRKLLGDTVKFIRKADVATIRNGLDHQRDPSRFPTINQLQLCITYLKKAVRFAEQHRIYPVTFWYDSINIKSFGSKEITFKNHSGEILTIFRPATLSSIPDFYINHPTLIAPVNFLGSADCILQFRVLEESEFSRYWSDFPKISETIPENSVKNNISEEFNPSEKGISEIPFDRAFFDAIFQSMIEKEIDGDPDNTKTSDE